MYGILTTAILMNWFIIVSDNGLTPYRLSCCELDLWEQFSVKIVSGTKTFKIQTIRIIFAMGQIGRLCYIIMEGLKNNQLRSKPLRQLVTHWKDSKIRLLDLVLSKHVERYPDKW